MNDRPAYESVAAQLREAILAGEVSGRLPSLAGLATRYGVTPDVARRAVEILRSEGLLFTRQGSGTYARTFERITRRTPDRLSLERWGTGRSIQQADARGREYRVETMVQEVPADELVGQSLDVATGSPVLSRKRRHFIDDRPVQLSESLLPLDIVGGTQIVYTDVGPGGTYARLAELGHAPRWFTERIGARSPRPHEVEALQLGTSVGGIVFDVTRFAYTATDRCVEVNRMVLDATVYDLENTFQA